MLCRRARVSPCCSVKGHSVDVGKVAGGDPSTSLTHSHSRSKCMLYKAADVIVASSSFLFRGKTQSFSKAESCLRARNILLSGMSFVFQR